MIAEVDASPIGQPLWAEVFNLIRAEIESQHLRPGDRLPEVELAERYGVSRGPVRSALVELERIGLVTISPRRGAQVATITAEDVEELYELRTGLELLALGGLLHRSSTHAIAGLAEPLERYGHALKLGDRREVVMADLSFHRGLCRLSGNGRLLRAWESHADQIRLVIGAVQYDERWQNHSSLDEHQAVLDALLAGDLEASRNALSVHLLHAREVMMSLVEDGAFPHGSATLRRFPWRLPSGMP